MPKNPPRSSGAGAGLDPACPPDEPARGAGSVEPAQRWFWPDDRQECLSHREVEWDPASIFEHVLRDILPRAPRPSVQVEFRPFANLNHTIRLRDGRIMVRLSDLLRDAPPAVLAAVAAILISKLYGRPVLEKFRRRYRRYVNRPGVRRQIEKIRHLRGRKQAGPAAGKVYDLNDLFERLNVRYFHGLLGQPRLGWSRSPSRTALGHFDPAHNTIVISRFLDRREVPRIVVEFVLYHEMLHLRYPVEHGSENRRVHPARFVQEEKKFEHHGEARKALNALLPRNL